MGETIFYIPDQAGYRQLTTAYVSQAIGPSHPLYGYVSEFFQLSVPADHASINVITDGCNDLLILFDSVRVRSFLSPSIEGSRRFLFPHTQTILGVRFLPGATAQFLREDMTALIGWVPEIHCFLRDFNQVELCLLEDETFDHRCALLTTYLTKRLPPKDAAQQIIDTCAVLLGSTDPRTTVENLSQKTGYSSRYLRRLFGRYVGHSPKEFAGILRIQAIVRWLKAHPQANLADTAVRFGFSDQSHMNRTCQRYLGVTPGTIQWKPDWAVQLSPQRQLHLHQPGMSPASCQPRQGVHPLHFQEPKVERNPKLLLPPGSEPRHSRRGLFFGGLRQENFKGLSKLLVN